MNLESTFKVKLLLTKLLNGAVPSEEDLAGLQAPQCTPEKEVQFDELDCNDIISLTLPFIRGAVRNDKEELLEFLKGVIRVGIFEKEDGTPCFSQDDFLVPTTRTLPYTFDLERVLAEIQAGQLGRGDKIYMNSSIRDFHTGYFEWDDKDFLRDLLKICSYKSLLQLRSVINEENVAQLHEDDQVAKPMQAYNLMACGHLNPVGGSGVGRKDLLKRRFNPTMTIEEYVEKLMSADRLKRRVSKEKSDDHERKMDEADESMRGFRGNTRNIG